MPAGSELGALPSLPHTWRPFGVRIAVVGFGVMLFVVCAAAWFGFDDSVRARFNLLKRMTLLLMGAGFAAVGWRGSVGDPRPRRRHDDLRDGLPGLRRAASARGRTAGACPHRPGSPRERQKAVMNPRRVAPCLHVLPLTPSCLARVWATPEPTER